MLSLLVVIAAIPSILACPQHDLAARGKSLNKRAGGEQDWAYEASYNWGMINKNYTLCQTGTQQSPIPLQITQGLSTSHVPSFDAASYSAVPGALSNWGYGPAFTTSTNSDFASGPAMRFDNTTLYLKGLHIHSPADHSVQGDRSKAELHLVHADATGKERGVIAIRIDPGNADSLFFSQMLGQKANGTVEPASNPIPSFTSQETIPMNLDILEAIREVNMFNDFWTYEGSLTSPPCTEGIRWWVARNTMYVSIQQMQAILAISTFSARVEQEVWMHGINR
ncbi:related to carbonic anhydrase precursor [Rhynchosporium agropyri]|uniref:Related to carbonic anhydrase n=3 Tax=Rhynchosporium TaxID=38037 RepID=A0A1E1MR24_RHYSE|nr:related to carbonic anhydrase precursor [Rhynchosporium commune]CZT07344.1 related to carbonic anhydrase precursor [Rhynchosporium agropyri]CZT51547.1 related to carbonic anhydrase precursor [Rhynchosporium secalis]